MAGPETSETDALNRSRELNATQCGEHQALMRSISGIQSAIEKLDSKFERVLEKLADGQTTFATLELRISQVERIVYGVVGVAGLALVGAIVSLVLRR